MDKLRLTSLDIEITTHCNLQCSYCYLMNNLIKGREKREDMSDETIDKILDFIQNYTVPMNSQKHPTIHFYGGEPILRFNKVKYFIEKARERKILLNWVIFTNGTVGTSETAKYCKENNIHLVRGLAGCRQAQDAVRPNTYDKYQEMTKLFHDERGHRRMTTTPETVKYVAQSIRELVEAGSIGATPMPDYYANWREEDIQEFEKQMWEVGKFYIERSLMGKPFYSYFLSRDLACRYTSKVPMSYCAAGKSLQCISVNGYFYLCHRFVTEPIDSPFCAGHIDEILAGIAKGYGEIVKQRHIECEKKLVSDKCMTCEGRYGCEQGCHHSNWKTTGSMSTPSELACRLHKVQAKINIELLEPALKHIEDWWAKGNIRPEAQQYLKRRYSTHGNRIQSNSKRGESRSYNNKNVHNNNVRRCNQGTINTSKRRSYLFRISASESGRVKGILIEK
jgi:radical SAM protein with 4Fe4S-binding SPASM domain